MQRPHKPPKYDSVEPCALPKPVLECPIHSFTSLESNASTFGPTSCHEAARCQSNDSHGPGREFFFTQGHALNWGYWGSPTRADVCRSRCMSCLTRAVPREPRKTARSAPQTSIHTEKCALSAHAETAQRPQKPPKHDSVEPCALPKPLLECPICSITSSEYNESVFGPT